MILDSTLHFLVESYGTWQCLAWPRLCVSPGDWNYNTVLQADQIVNGAPDCDHHTAHLKVSAVHHRNYVILVPSLRAVQQIHMLKLDLARQDAARHKMSKMWNHVDDSFHQHRKRQRLWKTKP